MSCQLPWSRDIAITNTTLSSRQLKVVRDLSVFRVGFVSVWVIMLSDKTWMMIDVVRDGKLIRLG